MKPILLCLILGFYGLLYIATSEAPPCDEDCRKVESLYKDLQKERKYIISVYHSRRSTSDSLFVLVNAQQGIDWSRFADTVCRMAGEKGLTKPKLYILENGTYPYDTLAKKQCN